MNPLKNPQNLNTLKSDYDKGEKIYEENINLQKVHLEMLQSQHSMLQKKTNDIAEKIKNLSAKIDHQQKNKEQIISQLNLYTDAE